MADKQELEQALTSGAQMLVRTATEKQRQRQHDQMHVFHWLLALVERHGAMAEAMSSGLNASTLQRYLQEQLGQGKLGDPLDLDTVLRQAQEHAKARAKSQAAERDLAVVILKAAGYPITEDTTVVPAKPTPDKTPEPAGEPALAGSPTYQPRAKRLIPTLEQYGRDLTREALEGKLAPIVGRYDEIQLLIETLARRTKRNPVLVGPAGVGKTAIVEGFAQRVVKGEVPPLLQDVRVMAIQPSTLVAGAHMVGELEKRMKSVLSEASQDGIILFIDEVHSMMGAGGMPGVSDMGSLLKPALARGEIACIAATTDDEYRRFIEPDGALERRFQPIRVQELTAEETIAVLMSLRDLLARQYNVQVPDEVLRWLVDFGQRFLRNRHLPDKGVDLLE